MLVFDEGGLSEGSLDAPPSRKVLVMPGALTGRSSVLGAAAMPAANMVLAPRGTAVAASR